MEGLYVLGFCVNVVRGDQQNSQGIRKRPHPLTVISGKDRQLLNGEPSCHPLVVELIVQSRMVGNVCQQCFKSGSHDQNVPPVIIFSLRNKMYRRELLVPAASFHSTPTRANNRLLPAPWKFATATSHCVQSGPARPRFRAGCKPSR